MKKSTPLIIVMLIFGLLTTKAQNSCSLTATILQTAVPTCSGGNNGILVASSAGGSGTVTYRWSDNNSTTGASLTASSGVYVVTATDANSCTAQAAIALSQPAALQFGTGQRGTAGFEPNNYIQSWTVPAGVTYITILALGGEGGGIDYPGHPAGNGVLLYETCPVNAGDIIDVAVGDGGEISDYWEGGSGGGGSFIWDATTSELLAVAGGGGAAGNYGNGYNGSLTIYPNPSGGIGELGGKPLDQYAGGGGTGVLGNGGSGDDAEYQYEGQGGWDMYFGFGGGNGDVGGGNYGQLGGFGGGGGGGYSGGGGGGGYNGGDGLPNGSGGAGGGSYYSGNLLSMVIEPNGGGGVVGLMYRTPGTTIPAINNNVTCFGGNNGQMTAPAVEKGVTPYTYLWTPNNETTTTISNLSAGVYTLTVTDANGCSITTSGTITQPNSISLSVYQSTNPTCYGNTNGTSTANASGGSGNLNYTWNDANSSSNSILTSGAGTFIVTVTDSYGCNATASVTVTQPPTLSLSSYQTGLPTCYGNNNGRATAISSGGYGSINYQWNDENSTTGATLVAGAGSYEVLATDAHGCTSNSSIVLTQPNQLIANANQTQSPSCNGSNNGIATSTVSGGIGQIAYSWNDINNSTGNSLLAGAGNYILTVTDNNNCTAIANVTITQPGILSLSISSETNPMCNGGNGSITANGAVGGTSPYNYSWSPSGGTGLTANSLSAGNYTLTATDANSCSISISATINQPAALSINIASQVNPTCYGANNGIIIAEPATGGTPPYTYSWNNNLGTNLSLSGISAGTYIIEVSDAGNCNIYDTIILTQPLSPFSTSTSVISNVNCYGGALGSAQATPSGGTSPYSYSWSNNSTTSVITGLSAGIYNLNVTDALNCSASASVSISQPSAISISGSVSSNVNCFGGNNGSITVSTNGGINPYSYSWSNGSTANSINNLDAGNYSVTVKDANGCSANTTITVSQPANLIFGETTQVILPFTYSESIQTWTVPAGVSSITLSAIGAPGGGSYGLYTMGGAGAIVEGICSVIPGHTINIITGGTGANNDNFDGASGGGGTFVWDNTNSILLAAAGGGGGGGTDGNGYNGSLTITPNPSGGSGENGGQSLDEFAGGAGAGFLGNGGGNGSLQGLGGYDYANGFMGGHGDVEGGDFWQSGGFGGGGGGGYAGGGGGGGYTGGDGLSGSLGGAGGGSYLNGTITFTNTNQGGNGAVVIIYPIILHPSIPTINQNVSCYNGNNGMMTSPILYGGKYPYTYSWSPTNSTDTIASNLSAGTYSITAIDANGCTVSVSGTITQPNILTVTTSQTSSPTCNGNTNGSAIATTAGGTGVFSYRWNDNNSTVSSTLIAGAGNYYVNVVDANECTGTASIIISQPSAITVTVNETVAPGCYGYLNGQATAYANGGTGSISYQWNDVNNSTGAILTSGSGVYNVTASDANGCTSSSSVTLTQPNQITLSAHQTVAPSCYGNNTGVAVSNESGGSGIISYQWNDINSSTTPNLTAGANSYILRVTDASGCIATVSVLITQPSSLSISIASQNNISCFGGVGNATANSANGGTLPYNYSWFPNISTNLAANNLSAGTYSITVTDANSCTAYHTVTITQPNVLSISFASQTNISCHGLSNGNATANMASGGKAPYTYSWSPGNSTNLTQSNLSCGTYMITVRDNNACSASASCTITQPANALTTILSVISNEVCYGNSIGSAQATASGGTAPYNYSWSNNSTNTSISSVSAGTYKVTVTDANSCTNSASVSITQPANFLITASTMTNVKCNGSNTGYGRVTSSGGTSPYTYSWSNGATTSSVTSFTAGTYTIYETDKHGCTVTSSIIITQPTPLALGGPSTGSAAFSYYGGVQSWTVPATVTSVTVSAAGSCGGNSYNYGGYGVNMIGTTTLTPGHTINVVTGGIGISCYGDQGGGGGGGTFIWDNTTTTIIAVGGGGGGGGVFGPGYNASSTNSANPCGGASELGGQNLDNYAGGGGAGFFGNGSGGGYSSGSGGLDMANGFLGGNGDIGGNNTNVTGGYGGGGGGGYDGGGGGGGYNGGNGLANGAGGAGGGSYINGNVISTNNNTNTTGGAIIVYPIIGTTYPIVNQNVSCFGGNGGEMTAPVPIGGVSPYTYSWSPSGGGTCIASNLSAGTYTLTVTDYYGCTITTSATITQPPAISLTAHENASPSCYGSNNGIAVATASGGTATITYKWNNAGSTTGCSLTAAAGTYTVTATDSKNCTSNANVVITQPAIVTATASETSAPLCYGNTGIANVNATGGTGSFAYNWNTSTTGSTLINGAGTYTVTSSDVNGCSAIASVIITQPAAITVSIISVTPSCINGCDGTADASASGGTGSINYLWNDINNTITPNLIGCAGIYVVTATDINGCNATSVAIILPSLLDTCGNGRGSRIHNSDDNNTVTAKQDLNSTGAQEKHGSLYQNIPNPFTSETKINYFLPTGTQGATLVFFDIFGNKIKVVDLNQTGDGTIYISSDNLKQSFYSYSLIINNKIVDTKRMLIQR